MGREGKGVSSSRPELVALTECLDDHEDNISLLYVTETQPLQITGRGRPQKDFNQITKESPKGSSDFISESQKAHRGDPLNEEADIRAEIGRHKEQKEVTWDIPTNRSINQ